MYVFSANPASSTFTDNSDVSLNSADLQKVNTVAAVAYTGTSGMANTPYIGTVNFTRAPVDASGNLYFVLNASTTTVLTATNEIIYEVGIAKN